MNTKYNRTFTGKLVVMLLLCSTLFVTSCKNDVKSHDEKKQDSPLRNKIALNAYSFNTPLRNDNIDIFDLMDFCAELGFDGVDITGYYFPGYPVPPSDEYIYSVKKRAFELGLDICGTGVKNDFCDPDPAVRELDKELTKNWILVAEKLGAPALRIMQGNKISEEHSWDEMAGWAAEVIRECADFGKDHGVVL